MKKVLTICLSPVIQKTLIFNRLEIGSVNRTNEYYKFIAGKGINVTRALLCKNADVQHITQLGGHSRKWFLKQAKKENLKIKWVDSKSEIRSCYTLLNPTKDTTELVEEAPKVHNNTNLKLIKKLKSIIKSKDIVVISGSKANGYKDDIIPEIVKISKNNNKCVILDVTGEDLKNSIKYKPNYIKINRDEFDKTFTQNYDDVSKELKNNGITLIITNSKSEILYRDDIGVKTYSPPIIDSPLNTTGCGDAFSAGMVYSLINNDSISELVKTGAEWGYLNSMTITPGDIK